VADEQKQEAQPTEVPVRTPDEVEKAQDKQERRDRRAAAAASEDDGIAVDRILARPEAFTGYSHAAVSNGLALVGKGSRKNVTVDEAREAAEAFRAHEVQYEN
jgi:hypothetical protein